MDIIRESMELAIDVVLLLSGFAFGFLLGRGDKDAALAKMQSDYLKELMKNELEDD